jgi:hypothetical protein
VINDSFVVMHIGMGENYLLQKHTRRIRR